MRFRRHLHGEGFIFGNLSATRLSEILERLRASFWFLPSVMAAAAVALSFAMVELDIWIGLTLRTRPGWFLTFGPEGARAILGAIASSMITVAGLTFSLTMLTLQLASSQFGPRLLRSFLRDRLNQIVLGTFISTFIYCLLVLRTVRGTEEASFVPHLSVATGFALAITSLAVLILFIHHTAQAIRLETVLAGLARETAEAIDRLYPAEIGREPPHVPGGPSPVSDRLRGFGRDGRTVSADSGGYVQVVDDEALLALAVGAGVVLRIEARPGRFVKRGDALVTAAPGERVTDGLADDLRAAVTLGDERTPRQDLAFSLRRIVDIAYRALPPGVNDPTTACYCIDRLEEALCRLAEREVPSAVRLDEAGVARVIAPASTLAEIALPAFRAVARYGLGDADVVRRLVAAIKALAARAPGERAALLALARAIRAEARAESAAFDAADIDPALGSRDGQPGSET
ncbi:MAG TPA: DUF2254 domain-containing protein [Paracoccus sp. (in: a-proteobacteria)]|nr:DUF2254 domain-containing protein [Paracoccus sp. (in: a-proteobacteria)]